MAGIPRFLLAQAGSDVVIEAYEGSGAYGDIYGDPVTVRAVVDASRRLVRDDAGTEVVSETTLYAPLSTVAPAGSRVTLPDGTSSTVITAKRRDGGRLPVPSHVEVVLT
ncbi:hypothetical protein [Saccharopolyspora taberi]|uniref:Uncharacterized protein n=1 Tax=Saccharopolyspora taberi TaxID=60895 RepID=A0ABN3V077_9PSEU